LPGNCGSNQCLPPFREAFVKALHFFAERTDLSDHISDFMLHCWFDLWYWGTAEDFPISEIDCTFPRTSSEKR